MEHLLADHHSALMWAYLIGFTLGAVLGGLLTLHTARKHFRSYHEFVLAQMKGMNEELSSSG